ncbi:anthrone oxygenase family protein [Actinoallomurus sp. NPDC052308]|uniref:anthrone oxygenase family protein n=1 Tax=Actinoallomurus sp. NPDC052308 TaxID=3155530 RepID=UPI003437C2CF
MALKNLQTVLLLAATVTTGLMAGLFAAFAYSVMPGLRRSDDRAFVEVMQNINKAIINGWFMLCFMGALVFLIGAAVLAWRGHGRPALPWIVAALVLYLVMFFVTSGVNVPLNNQLAKAGHPRHLAELAAVRHQFEARWVTWNVVRAVANLAAFACLAWALVVYGAHRDEPGAAPGRHSAATPGEAWEEGTVTHHMGAEGRRL